MIIPLLSLLMGSVGGFLFGRGRSLDKEQQAEEERKRLEAELAALQSGGGPRPLPPMPRPQQGDIIWPINQGDGLGAGQGPLPTDQYRPPDRTAVIKLPVDDEDFEQLGDAICTCYRALEKEHGGKVTHAQLRDCMLQAIYPDFEWPPVPGDPTEAALMWAIADFEARRLLFGSDLERCPKAPGVQPPSKGPGGFKVS